MDPPWDPKWDPKSTAKSMGFSWVQRVGILGKFRNLAFLVRALHFRKTSFLIGNLLIFVFLANFEGNLGFQKKESEKQKTLYAPVGG